MELTRNISLIFFALLLTAGIILKAKDLIDQDRKECKDSGGFYFQGKCIK